MRKNKGARRVKVIDFIFHTVEVIGSNPIAPTIVSMTYTATASGAGLS